VSAGGGDLRARDAMVTEPLALDGAATAREAGEAMARPEVRAVFVLDEGRLLGVITRKTLVREVVAAGRDPQTTLLRDIAEEPVATIESDMPLADAFHMLEERDLERVPVVDNGNLVGVLARGIVQRRLAEDEPPPEPDGEA
jgi:CBS domain-containing protein